MDQGVKTFVLFILALKKQLSDCKKRFEKQVRPLRQIDGASSDVNTWQQMDLERLEESLSGSRAEGGWGGEANASRDSFRLLLFAQVI